MIRGMQPLGSGRLLGHQGGIQRAPSDGGALWRGHCQESIVVFRGDSRLMGAGGS